MSRIAHWRTWANIGLIAFLLLFMSMVTQYTVGGLNDTLKSVGISPVVYTQALIGIAILSMFIMMIFLNESEEEVEY